MLTYQGVVQIEVLKTVMLTEGSDKALGVCWLTLEPVILTSEILLINIITLKLPVTILTTVKWG